MRIQGSPSNTLKLQVIVPPRQSATAYVRNASWVEYYQFSTTAAQITGIAKLGMNRASGFSTPAVSYRQLSV